MSGAALWANRKREGEGSASDTGGASQLSWGPSILAPELGRTKLKAETLWRLLSFIPSFCYGAAGGVSIVSGVALWRCEKSLAKFGISITNCLQHSWKVYLQYFAEMVRIQGGGGGEFGGRQGSKDMRDRDTAEGRDRGKPRTVANMRERDRTLRWLFFGIVFHPLRFILSQIGTWSSSQIQLLNIWIYLHSSRDHSCSSRTLGDVES